MEVSNLNNALTSLPINYRELVELRIGHKDIKSLGDIELKKACTSIIARAFTYSTPNGQTDPVILEHQSIELLNCVKAGYMDLTIPEIQKAFKMGLDGVFGQYFGMCAKTYTQFLKGFKNNPERSKSWLDYVGLIDKPKTEEKPRWWVNEQNRESLKRYHAKYKKSGKLEAPAILLYKVLTEWKGVEVTQGGKTFKTVCTDKEIRNKFYNECKVKYENGLQKTKEDEERRGNFSLAKHIGEMLSTGKYESSSIELQFKTKLVMWYFDNHDL